MEGLAYVGGALVAIGGVTAWRARKSRGPSFPVLLAVVAGGLVVLVTALVVGTRKGERSAQKPEAPAKSQPTANATTAPFDPWANPDIPAIREQVRAAYADYERVIRQAGLENKPELLDQVATGEQLALLKENIRRTHDLGLALLYEDEATVWAITPTPQFRNVSVQVKGTFSTWDVDPKTGQKVGEPLVKQGERNPVFVWSDGRWKVSSTAFFEGS